MATRELDSEALLFTFISIDDEFHPEPGTDQQQHIREQMDAGDQLGDSSSPHCAIYAEEEADSSILRLRSASRIFVGLPREPIYYTGVNSMCINTLKMSPDNSRKLSTCDSVYMS